ncbi:hypothetical protein Pmi06nite_36900 [Planotetraspora mira]|uniref:Uncharacterized protein n=1 Tax=Planotetraspora mira TaxID=58121 RepID=A0A8J3TNF4_9ACTN|nr:hypothetical protein Pmi06nite_36900 [Planotetraspora mira]
MTKTLPLRRTTCAPGLSFKDLKDLRTFMAPPSVTHAPRDVQVTQTTSRPRPFPTDIGLSGPFPASYDREL